MHLSHIWHNTSIHICHMMTYVCDVMIHWLGHTFPTGSKVLCIHTYEIVKHIRVFERDGICYMWHIHSYVFSWRIYPCFWQDGSCVNSCLRRNTFINSFVYVVGLFHKCDNESFICVWWYYWRFCITLYPHLCMCTYVEKAYTHLLMCIHAYTSMIRERESCEYVWESIMHICDMTQSFIWIFVTHVFVCVTRWFMCTFIFVAWYIHQRIHICDRTRSHTYVTESEMTQIVYYVYTCKFNSRFCIMYLYLCICKDRERTQSFFLYFYAHMCIHMYTFREMEFCGIKHSFMCIFVTHTFSCVTWWFMYAFICIVWYIY